MQIVQRPHIRRDRRSPHSQKTTGTPFQRRSTDRAQDSAEIGTLGYDQPAVDDLFDGSKPNFGRKYDKYIASVQVPHPQVATEYYNEASDKAAASAYYGDIENMSGRERSSALSSLLKESHTPDPKGYHYTIAKHLYTNVDRHPDGSVKDVYTKEPIKTYEYNNISLDELEDNELNAIAASAGASPEVIGSWLAFQKGRAKLNCEHTVPQSWFNKAEPMKSDMHHLYACDIKTNSRRGNTPYGSYTPPGGKGEAARATLYFMARYPNIKLPYKGRQIEMLKQWSEADPPDLHEKHRNAEIAKIQGNRNPFIDHPEWVADFQP